MMITLLAIGWLLGWMFTMRFVQRAFDVDFTWLAGPLYLVAWPIVLGYMLWIIVSEDMEGKA